MYAIIKILKMHMNSRKTKKKSRNKKVVFIRENVRGFPSFSTFEISF